MATFADNNKVFFNYEVLEKYEAGIELIGFEVKSIRAGKAVLEGSYIIVRGGEAFLMNMQVPPYQEKNTPVEYDPRRTRKILLSRKELAELASIDQGGGAAGKGLTIVPISVYNKGNLIKVQIAVVRGKKQYDKRETIKRRETDRAVRREFKDR